MVAIGATLFVNRRKWLRSGPPLPPKQKRTREGDCLRAAIVWTSGPKNRGGGAAPAPQARESFGPRAPSARGVGLARRWRPRPPALESRPRLRGLAPATLPCPPPLPRPAPSCSRRACEGVCLRPASIDGRAVAEASAWTSIPKNMEGPRGADARVPRPTPSARSVDLASRARPRPPALNSSPRPRGPTQPTTSA